MSSSEMREMWMEERVRGERAEEEPEERMDLTSHDPAIPSAVMKLSSFAPLRDNQ